MRVLFCATPGEGHVRTLLPLLQALHARGHGVAWAGAAETHALVPAHMPVPCFDVGPGWQSARFRLFGRWPELSAARGTDAASRIFPKLYGAVIAARMLAPLQAALQAFKPELVIGENAALAVPLAAQAAGVPHVTQGVGMPLPAHRVQEAVAHLASHWLRLTGTPPPPDGGLYRHLYLDICPPSLQPEPLPAELPAHSLQPFDASATGPVELERLLPGPLAAQRELPLVYLSLGTMLNRPELLRTVLAALSGLPLRVVVATGPDVEPAQLQPLPPTVHAQRHLPQAELLPHCQLVISHGGAGTVYAAAAHGLPQLALPQMADQFVNTAALEHSHAGRVLLGAEQNLYAIRHAVQQLLSEPGYRQTAERLAHEIAQMPSADEVAQQLERWIEHGQPVPLPPRRSGFKLPA
jgi:UDP-N-acetylglucosamine:LPS N-acetylglucosamine transferase